MRVILCDACSKDISSPNYVKRTVRIEGSGWKEPLLLEMDVDCYAEFMVMVQDFFKNPSPNHWIIDMEEDARKRLEKEYK